MRNIQVFSNFQYLLTEKLNIDMAGMMHIDLDTPNGAAKARVSGELKFEQSGPILLDSITRTLYQESPITPDSYANIGLPGILENYEARTEKLRYDYQWLIQPLGSQYKTQVVIDV